MSPRSLFLAGCAAALLTANTASAKHTRPDDALDTDYYASPGTITLEVCGQVGGERGCFGNAQLTGFEQPCAVLEGKPKWNDNVQTRAIYILDKRTANSDPIALSVYKRTDTFSENDDTVQVAFERKIALGVDGGRKAKCFMAGGDKLLFAGTDAGSVAVLIDKASFALSTVGGSQALSAITADDRGYVAVTFDDFYTIYNPDGVAVSGGGGFGHEVGTRNGWYP